ncbi:mitochondrial import inner membrane translocase subunit TIM44-2-like [Rutidosis leptorrhynchoides]|uniref:mitochondrial import inner membrane translocase subunit TIM44-2-like n=1 Tax=Rutidosis leptorrhynchoides TaxID=125765 RepID=UPI003A994E85
MATRKLVRDVSLSKQLLYPRVSAYSQGSRPASRFRLLGASNGNSMYREFSVLSEFPKKIKDEVNRNQEFQQTVKELKEKMEELKGVKEDLKVSENLKEKVSAAKVEVKETLGIGKQESSSSANDDLSGKDGNDYKQSQGGDDNKQQSGFDQSAEIISDLAKMGYDIVKEELSAKPSKRKKALSAYYAASQGNVERSTRTDLTVVPQSRLSMEWEALKEKMQGHPVFKQFSGFSEPFQEMVEDMRERWETSDHRVLHIISDMKSACSDLLDETLFIETNEATPYKEITRLDPYFDLDEFVSDVQEIVKPVLKAYNNFYLGCLYGDIKVLEKYCFPEIVERCKAERKVCEMQGKFYDNKILFVSDIRLKETKMMGDSPLIIVRFKTQQVYCVRDRLGEITDGGMDTIRAVHYLWAMQLAELEEGCHIPIWKLREMQQVGIEPLLLC